MNFDSDRMHDEKAIERTKVRAIPPKNSKIRISDWMAKLIEKRLMKTGQYYGDIRISEDEYKELVERCETKGK